MPRFAAFLRTLEPAPRTAAPAPGPVQEAAVAVCLAPGDQADPHILLIKRSEHPHDPWSGHVGLPGGRRDPGDPSLLHTALRETQEEVGLNLSPDAFRGCLPRVNARRRDLPRDLWVQPFVFELDTQHPLQRNHEISGALWVPWRELAAADRATHVVLPPERGSVSLPAVAIAGDPPWVLWGLTYRLLWPLGVQAGFPLAGGQPIP